MAKMTGLNGQIFVSTDGGSNYTAIGEVKNCDLDRNTDMQDAMTNSSEGWADVLPGKKSWTASADELYDSADAGQDILRNALDGDTELDFKFVAAVGTGLDQWTGKGYISGHKLSLISMDGPVATNITITGNGPLVTGTQS